MRRFERNFGRKNARQLHEDEELCTVARSNQERRACVLFSRRRRIAQKSLFLLSIKVFLLLFLGQKVLLLRGCQHLRVEEEKSVRETSAPSVPSQLQTHHRRGLGERRGREIDDRLSPVFSRRRKRPKERETYARRRERLRTRLRFSSPMLLPRRGNPFRRSKFVNTRKKERTNERYEVVLYRPHE